ncbi:hypothetical protein Agub_g3747, partial [Astrephomene gubernaculifera]
MSRSKQCADDLSTPSTPHRSSNAVQRPNVKLATSNDSCSQKPAPNRALSPALFDSLQRRAAQLKVLLDSLQSNDRSRSPLTYSVEHSHASFGLSPASATSGGSCLVLKKSSAVSGATSSGAIGAKAKRAQSVTSQRAPRARSPHELSQRLQAKKVESELRKSQGGVAGAIGSTSILNRYAGRDSSWTGGDPSVKKAISKQQVHHGEAVAEQLQVRGGAGRRHRNGGGGDGGSGSLVCGSSSAKGLAAAGSHAREATTSSSCTNSGSILSSRIGGATSGNNNPQSYAGTPSSEAVAASTKSCTASAAVVMTSPSPPTAVPAAAATAVAPPNGLYGNPSAATVATSRWPHPPTTAPLPLPLQQQRSHASDPDQEDEEPAACRPASGREGIDLRDDSSGANVGVLAAAQESTKPGMQNIPAASEVAAAPSLALGQQADQQQQEQQHQLPITGATFSVTRALELILAASQLPDLPAPGIPGVAASETAAARVYRDLQLGGEGGATGSVVLGATSETAPGSLNGGSAVAIARAGEGVGGAAASVDDDGALGEEAMATSSLAGAYMPSAASPAAVAEEQQLQPGQRQPVSICDGDGKDGGDGSTAAAAAAIGPMEVFSGSEPTSCAPSSSSCSSGSSGTGGYGASEGDGGCGGNAAASAATAATDDAVSADEMRMNMTSPGSAAAPPAGAAGAAAAASTKSEAATSAASEEALARALAAARASAQVAFLNQRNQLLQKHNPQTAANGAMQRPTPATPGGSLHSSSLPNNRHNSNPASCRSSASGGCKAAAAASSLVSGISPNPHIASPSSLPSSAAPATAFRTQISSSDDGFGHGAASFGAARDGLAVPAAATAVADDASCMGFGQADAAAAAVTVLQTSAAAPAAAAATGAVANGSSRYEQLLTMLLSRPAVGGRGSGGGAAAAAPAAAGPSGACRGPCRSCGGAAPGGRGGG